MDRLTGTRFASLPVWLLEAAVSDRAVRLYAVLQTFVSGREGVAWPSRPTLAGRLSCSVDSLDRALAELVDAGAVEVQHRFAAGRQMHTSNHYRLIADPPEGGRTGAARWPQPCGHGGRTGAALELDPLNKTQRTPLPPAETQTEPPPSPPQEAPPPAPPAIASQRTAKTNPRAKGTNPRGPRLPKPPDGPATVTPPPFAPPAPPPATVDPELVRRARQALRPKASPCPTPSSSASTPAADTPASSPDEAASSSTPPPSPGQASTGERSPASSSPPSSTPAPAPAPPASSPSPSPSKTSTNQTLISA